MNYKAKSIFGTAVNALQHGNDIHFQCSKSRVHSAPCVHDFNARCTILKSVQLVSASQPNSDVIMMLGKNLPKYYVIVTSHRSEVSSATSYNVIKTSSVGVVKTYLNENVTETFCLQL